MKDPESRTIFAGVDGRTDTELPEWYQDRHGDADPVTFAEAVRVLPQAVDWQQRSPEGGCKHMCRMAAK